MHGSAFGSVKALPDGKVLHDRVAATRRRSRPSTATRVRRWPSRTRATSQEAQRAGDADDQEDADADQLTETIPLINPGETKTVTFTHIGIMRRSAPDDASRSTCEPVPGEATHDNNSAEYPVIFSLEVARGSSTAAWIAIAAACSRAAWRSRSSRGRLVAARDAVRAAQHVLLGGGESDLVDFAVSLQGRIDDLHRAVDEVAAGLSRVDRRVDGACRRRRSSATTPTRARAASSPRPSRCSTRAHRRRRQRDPGPRLRADLREGARPRPRRDRALAGGGGGGRARDGEVASLRWTFSARCSRFSS